MVSPEMLRRYPYFAGVSEESLKRVATISDEKMISAGEVIFREGQDSTCLHIVVAGQVDIQFELGNGERRTVDTLVGGDLLVLSALVEPYKITATSVARTAVRLISIDARQLRQMMEADPLLGFRLMQGVAKAMSDRLHGARVQIASM